MNQEKKLPSVLKYNEIQNIQDNTDILDSIQLPEEEQVKRILGEVAKKSICRQIPIIGEILEFAQNVKDQIREQKMNILFNKFAKKFETQDQIIGRLTSLFRSASGLILFQKVVHILDNGIMVEETEAWIDLFANVLRNITNSEFEKQFDEHSYLLAQIDTLTPHSLLLLSRYVSWKVYQFQNSTTMSGQTIVGDWDIQISDYFASNLKITDRNKKERIRHAFKELESRGLFKITHEKGASLTVIGEEIFNFVT